VSAPIWNGTPTSSSASRTPPMRSLTKRLWRQRCGGPRVLANRHEAAGSGQGVLKRRTPSPSRDRVSSDGLSMPVWEDLVPAPTVEDDGSRSAPAPHPQDSSRYPRAPHTAAAAARSGCVRSHNSPPNASSRWGP
jgi:hypothetical protein